MNSNLAECSSAFSIRSRERLPRDRHRTTSRWCCICSTATRQRCWSAIRTSELKKVLEQRRSARQPAEDRPPRQPDLQFARSFWRRSIRNLRWCRQATTTRSAIPVRRSCNASPTATCVPIRTDLAGAVRSIWTALRCRLSRFLAERFVGIGRGMSAKFVDHRASRRPPVLREPG